jgi:hypothetical protein
MLIFSSRVVVSSTVRLIVILRSAFVIDFTCKHASLNYNIQLTIHADATAPAIIWSSVECNLAIICASLPTTKVLFRGLFSELRNTGKSNAAKNGQLSLNSLTNRNKSYCTEQSSTTNFQTGSLNTKSDRSDSNIGKTEEER